MASAKDILSADDYSNYRSVRAVAIFFPVLGSLAMLVGLIIALGGGNGANQRDSVPPIVGVGILLVGLTGVAGGVAVLIGNRTWVPLIYVMAAIYVIQFPIGTILSLTIFRGLSGYLDSVERLRRRRRRRRREDDEDDDQRPRRRRARFDEDDEEEDDRPRRRRARSEDDEDENDDRPRRSDDDDDDDRPRRRARRVDDEDDPPRRRR